MRANSSALPRGASTGLAAAQSRRAAAGAWQRLSHTLTHVLAFGLVATVLHEFFHFVALRALGGAGYITFDWNMGLTHYTSLPDFLWAVQLSGGLLTGVFLLYVFWFWPWSNGSTHSTNTEVAAFAWALGNLVYAPAETLTSSPAVGAIAFGLGFGVAGLLYFTRLMNWLVFGE